MSSPESDNSKPEPQTEPQLPGAGPTQSESAPHAAPGSSGGPGLTAGAPFERLGRHFTESRTNPLDGVSWTTRRVPALEGGKLPAVEAPSTWSDVAVGIAASKYLRRVGPPDPAGQGETSVRQLIQRVVQTIRQAGQELGGYFADSTEAENFEAELSFLLVNQCGAFNSPVWFNCGLWHAYGIEGRGGNWAWTPRAEHHGAGSPSAGSPAAGSPSSDSPSIGSESYVETQNAYQRPQCSACFIQSVDDDLMAIFDLLKSEARLFKYGSGTGTNFSSLRSRFESLSTGGRSSGLLSFLEVFDRAAGATKSGGTARRAAKMVSLDVDHPEILDFIDWKVREEAKARVLVAAGYAPGLDGEAYHSVQGQNSNNSVRISDAFMQAVTSDATWQTRAVTDGHVVSELPARDIWARMARAAHACGDPGLQFADATARWHTCPHSGPIRASNPCSEFLFLDDSACNLASLNLAKFLGADGTFQIDDFRQAVRTFVIAQEILVDLSSYPTQRIAQNSHEFRPLGLGFANLGGMLMRMGLAYDSREARDLAAGITALMTGTAYATSGQLAAAKGAFAGFAQNRAAMLNVVRGHSEYARRLSASSCPKALAQAALEQFVRAEWLGNVHGFRNAQVTLLAPTGTIGLLMDCDTTGIEPEFALVKRKQLVSGEALSMVNQSVAPALTALGYDAEQTQRMLDYLTGTPACEAALTLEGAPGIDPKHLPVFDCAVPSGRGRRFLNTAAHLRMMAVLQPLLSGGISKTVNLPESAGEQEVESVFREAWALGLKSISVYRSGSKQSAPLSTPPRGPRTVAIEPLTCPRCGSDAPGGAACFQCPSCGQPMGCE